MIITRKAFLKTVSVKKGFSDRKGVSIMKRAMRRGKQALTKTEITAVLMRNTSGVLALNGDGGYPYTVPLSYVYLAGKIYFHCAKAGYKLDAIEHSAKASFCVIDRDKVVPEAFSTDYISVIVFGKAHIVTDEEEKRFSIGLLAGKYGTGDEEAAEREIKKEWKGLMMIRFDIEEMSGKAASAVIKNREAYFPRGGKACSCQS